MRTDLERLRDIIEASNLILQYMHRLRDGSHSGDEDVFHDAILHQLMVLGEASVNIDTGLKKKYQSVPWATIKAFRNILVHEYSGVRWDLVWNAVDQIPGLLNEVKQILLHEYGIG